jgi:hypothetical protein
METRVQKIHELIIARVSAVSRCEDDDAFQSDSGMHRSHAR